MALGANDFPCKAAECIPTGVSSIRPSCRRSSPPCGRRPVQTGAFSSNDFDTLVDLQGVGIVPINVAKICMWTWVCAPPPLGPDNHANAAGYAVIAGVFAIALGL